MTKHAILIGINQIPEMPYLASPSSYAIKMKNWAEGQGYITALFVDEPRGESTSGECTRTYILNTVSTIIDEGTDQLLIYFAGHGVERAAGEDIWLFPGYLRDTSESASVLSCQQRAYRSGIKHVVFISDACRSASSATTVQGLDPGALFPNLTRNNRTEIDTFYSTHSGAKSIDVMDEDGNYRSVYSDNLLKCLNGEVTEVIRPIKRLNPPFPAVLSHELNDYLKTKVPDEIYLATGKKQFPIGSVSSSDPLFLSKFSEQVLVETIGETGLSLITDQEPIPVDTEVVSEKLNFYLRAKGGSSAREMQQIKRDFKLDYDFFTADALFQQGETGLYVKGVRNPLVFSSRQQDRQWNDARRNFSSPQIFDFSDVDHGSNAMYFIGNYGGKRFYPITLLRGFFTQVVFHKNELLTVNYFPTDPNGKHESRHYANEVAERKSNIIMAAKKGIFQSTYELNQGGNYYRKYKHLEPTLGLFAAYAYFQNGDFEGVHSLYDFLQQNNQSILGDISLLERLSNRYPSTQQNDMIQIPLLTQGWSYIDLLGYNPLENLVPYLQPGLWTSFSREGFRNIHDNLTQL
ncbi:MULTISPECIES: caspase family protein [Chryseobacterium]|uniref:Peptidase C14 caspase domain-containing protein n=1 Tax=Chryseobacterium indologenes TaxID=253 RepID=A0A0N0ZYX4_CHRID|nr:MULTISPECIES: caspase family protein [Chryseobacterium]KPE52949.1 hypothetical protein AOB46_02890 [Chryseobacterium indologenes]PWW20140.1 caspase domain-containing protein [Chryseobacterium sp. AG844]